MSGAICGVSRGRYLMPVPVMEAKINWAEEQEGDVEIPEKYPCEHDNHWLWGKGTRNGQKLYYPTMEMFYQKWHLTDDELKEAIDQYDIFSLEMTGRIICRECAKKELEIYAAKTEIQNS
jgi:hypothetical protein